MLTNKFLMIPKDLNGFLFMTFIFVNIIAGVSTSLIQDTKGMIFMSGIIVIVTILGLNVIYNRKYIIKKPYYELSFVDLCISTFILAIDAFTLNVLIYNFATNETILKPYGFYYLEVMIPGSIIFTAVLAFILRMSWAEPIIVTK